MVVTFVKLGQHLTVGLTQQSLKLSCTNNIIISCWENSARVNLAALTSALTTQRMNGLWIGNTFSLYSNPIANHGG